MDQQEHENQGCDSRADFGYLGMTTLVGKGVNFELGAKVRTFALSLGSECV